MTPPRPTASVVSLPKFWFAWADEVLASAMASSITDAPSDKGAFPGRLGPAAMGMAKAALAAKRTASRTRVRVSTAFVFILLRLSSSHTRLVRDETNHALDPTGREGGSARRRRRCGDERRAFSE